MLEEIYICVKHIGMTYQDALTCTTYERRFFLSLLMNENRKKMEDNEERIRNSKANNVSGKGNKGSRTTKIGGDQLKQKLLSGEIPNE